MNVKAQQIVEEAQARVGEPYVFGALGELCTPQNRGRRVRDSHPTIKSKCQVLNGKAKDCNGCKWKGAQMYDCRGFTYYLLKQVGIQISTVGATTQWKTDSWAAKGTIQQLPELVCCLFREKDGKMEHTGMYIGNGEVIECSVNVMRSRTPGNWTHWAIPRGLYTDEEIRVAGAAPMPTPNLKRGSKGDLVRQLQSDLISLGYEMPKYGADGSFGAETESCVKQFQRDNQLTADGIVGEKTRAAIAEALKNQAEKPTITSTVRIPGMDKEEADMLMRVYQDATAEAVLH